MSKKLSDYRKGVDVDWVVKKSKKNVDRQETLDMNQCFNILPGIVATCHETKNLFSYVKSRAQLLDFMLVAGESNYIGREGIEFYPQEMTIFEAGRGPSTNTCISLRNIQVKKSKYKVPQSVVLLERKFLYPLVKGIDIMPFHVKYSGLIVPFPYDGKDTRLPIPITKLALEAPRLASFYQRFKSLILAQTSYNERIIGKTGAFYALARVGAYSFAKHYVVFRDNTRWGAAVVSDIETDWGGLRHPLFQNHCVSICEDVNGNFITRDEAHFICGIMNAPIIFEYMSRSSDSRSFPIRPRIYIPKYDPANRHHAHIVKLSKRAHQSYDNRKEMEKIGAELNATYLRIASAACASRQNPDMAENGSGTSA